MNASLYIVTIVNTGFTRSFRTRWEATDRIFRLKRLWGLEATLTRVIGAVGNSGDSGK